MQSLAFAPSPGPRTQARCGRQRRCRLLCVADASSKGKGGSSRPQAATSATASPAAPTANTNGSAVPDVGLSGWAEKSALDILRSDGHSCSRETVQPCGSLKFAHPSSQQNLLVWKTRPKTVMVLKKLGDELYHEYVEVVRYLGEELGMKVVVEPEPHKDLRQRETGLPYLATFTPEERPELHSYIDFVVCLGGDGLLLHAATLFGSAMPPLISFKLGSLGFLTSHSFNDYKQDLQEVVNGVSELDSCQVWDSVDGSVKKGILITLRMRLEAELWRNGTPLPGAKHEVLNEVVISRGSNPYLSNIEVYEQGKMITKVQADGVMIATPTGSTAYNVAAGGSMVHPSTPAILFTPICPHSLNFRPVVLPDYVELELRIADTARCPAVICFDGRDSGDMLPGDSVKIRMSMNPVTTINSANRTTDWFGAIQRCFQWSERIEQKAIKEDAAKQLAS